MGERDTQRLRHRRFAFAVISREGGSLPHVGSVSEADDAVQEARLRLSSADTSSVENLGEWLTRVVARDCRDRLFAGWSRSQA